MTVIYAAGLEVGGSNTMTATVAGSAATITSGTYMAGDRDTNDVTSYGSVAYGGTRYSAFSTAVKTAFDAATSSTFTVSWSEQTGLYTVSRATNFTLSFSTAADLRLRAALGFSGNKSGTNTYTSDYVPAYIIRAALGARSDVSDLQEPDDVGEENVSDGGLAFVPTRKTSDQLSKWYQAMEARTAVYARARAYSVGTGWAFEDFFKLTRGSHPFLCMDSNISEASNGTLHKLTAKGAAFKPERVAADFDDLWNIPFVTRDLGVFS